MKDRALLVGGLTALVLGMLGLLSPAWLAPRAAIVPPWQGQANGHVKAFTLTVGRTRWELKPGKVIEAHAYNAQVPGPEIRVTEGDTVRVTVTNELPEPTTVHW